MGITWKSSCVALFVLVCALWIIDPNLYFSVQYRQLPAYKIEKGDDLSAILPTFTIPTKLTNTLVAQWKAITTPWTKDLLHNTLKGQTLQQCKNGTTPLFVLQNPQKPFKQPQFEIIQPDQDIPLKSTYVLQNVTADTFFQVNQRSSNYLYFSGNIHGWNEVLYPDVVPNTDFYIQESWFTERNEHYPSEIMIWMGDAGVIANTHYDRSHNVFIQLSGRKLWTLYPPTDWFAMYLFPSIHPSYHQSQVGNLNQVDTTLFPLFKRRSTPYQVMLEPGDAIYIPRMALCFFAIYFLQPEY
jgi:hypothetical protein